MIICELESGSGGLRCYSLYTLAYLGTKKSVYNIPPPQSWAIKSLIFCFWRLKYNKCMHTCISIFNVFPWLRSIDFFRKDFVPVCPKIHTLVNESKIWVKLIIIKSLIRCVNIGAYWGYDLNNIPENAWNFNSEDFQVCVSLKMSRIYNIKSIDWSYVISRFITFCSRLYCSSEVSPIKLSAKGLPD